MKKRFLLYALVALISVVGCKKDPVVDDNQPVGAGENAKNVFSVSAGHKVRIAEGNLQYRATTDVWRFAQAPWESMGEGNLEASESYDGWIDCFSWGTSGYEGQMPWESGTSNVALYHDGSISGTQYDWGVHNAIRSGDYTYPAGTWRTITAAEWRYLLFERSASTVAGVENARYLLASVADHPGMILFPDQFEMPQGVVFTTISSINAEGDYSYNQLTEGEWNKLHAEGCVFLPAAGCKLVGMNRMVSLDYLGCYWSGSYDVFDNDLGHTAAQVLFNPYSVDMGHAGIQYPRSVRLIRDLD